MRFGLLLLMVMAFAWASASHIAGGELTYECIGGNQYRITLKFYRDCLNANPNAGFDDPITLYIFRSDGTVHDMIDVPRPNSTPELIPENWDACVATPQNFCVEVGSYVTTVTLPPRVGGYDIGWTRCCRNNVITNLAAPECEGMTFSAHVPGSNEATCNSMPSFNNSPSLFLCAGEPYYFDYSATDPDGDSLVYLLTPAFSSLNQNAVGTGTGGNSPGCSNLLPPNLSNTNPMGPPPYLPVLYASGYSPQNPFGPGGYANINATTGFMEAFPASPGIYVMVVSVREYRNGILLSENKRDFQFHVIACQQQGPPPVLTHNLSGLNTNGDTIIALAGRPFCYAFTVTDQMAPSAIEVTPLSVSFGGNGGFPPPYATIVTNGSTPPVTGQICWRPNCAYTGDVVPMIISARDTNDCPNYNIVFDTVWVRVDPPVPSPPTLSVSTGILPMNGDTIVLGVQENFCFDFVVGDTVGGGSLIAQCLLKDTLGNLLGQVHSVTSSQVGDSLYVQVCWETFCNFGRVYMFEIVGRDEYQCPPHDEVRDTLYLRVPYPYNPVPVISTDITMNPLNGDTILANVNEEFCFNLMVVDTAISAGQGVNFGMHIIDENGLPISNNPYSYTITGTTDSISGEICWTPNCDNVDQLITLVVVGDQENACQQHSFALDTIYVRVTEPYKPKPLISHDLGPNFPGNIQVDVQDDEQFCFTFELRDTMVPSHLVYSLEVFYANGTPFTGPQPTLTYTTQTDDLLQGTICWTVPCDLANQVFEIKMTGRDTLDCRLSNRVFDSVLVSHTENIPSSLTFCNASVGDDDASVLIRYRDPLVESDLRYYLVYRKRDDEATYVLVDSITNLLDSAYTDTQGVDADGHSYCYMMAAMDRCGNVSPVTGQICTVVIEASPVDYTSAIEWTPFVGWNVLSYDLWRSSPIMGGFPSVQYVSLPATTLSYVDQDANVARLCYRVHAVSDGTGCADYSQSNEVCVNFPPTLYVPTGFTPNGDGLNDYFSSFGQFAESFSLDVWDRWGKLLFHTEDVVAGWDGTIDGVAAPEGVYVFRARVVGYDGQVMQRDGSVTLIR